MGLSVAQAEKLLSEYVSGTTLHRHCLTVSVVMRYWAELLNERDPEFWECVGLLHDIDFEKYPEQHCIKAKELLESEKKNYPDGNGSSLISDEMIHAIQSHGWKICCDVKPECMMEKVLYTIDELTGLIFACAKNKLTFVTHTKSKNFAAGCNRDVITEGAQMMGYDMNDIIEKCILAMRTRHEELGV